MEFEQFMSAIDFTEFAEIYMETRDKEWNLQFPDMTRLAKGDGSPRSEKEAAKVSEAIYTSIRMANNLDIIMLQKYHTWLLKRLYELFPDAFEDI